MGYPLLSFDYAELKTPDVLTNCSIKYPMQKEYVEIGKEQQVAEVFPETPWKSQAVISFRWVGARKIAGDRADNEGEADDAIK